MRWSHLIDMAQIQSAEEVDAKSVGALWHATYFDQVGVSSLDEDFLAERRGLRTFTARALESTPSTLVARTGRDTAPRILSGFVVARRGDARLPALCCSCAHQRRDTALGVGGEIEQLFVARAARGKGVGRALLLAAEERLAGGDITVFCLPSNLPACAFYERQGFASEGIVTHEVPISSGKSFPLDLVRYAKRRKRHCVVECFTRTTVFLRAYVARFAGANPGGELKSTMKRHQPQPWSASPSWLDIFWSFVGSFCGILAVASMHYLLLPLCEVYFEVSDLVGIVGSFGAHAVLVFAAPHSPLAQPYNATVGNLISAAVGVSVFKLLGTPPSPSPAGLPLLGGDGVNWLAAALAVSLAITAQHLVGALHPPGGAMALIAVIGSDAVKASGYWYVLMPGLVASLIQVGIGILINNCSGNEKRRYPQRWTPGVACFPPWKRRLFHRKKLAGEGVPYRVPVVQPVAAETERAE